MPHQFSKDGSVGINAERPTISTGIYASGDCIGGKITFDDMGGPDVSTGRAGHGGLIQSVCLADRAKQDANIDVIIFGADPSATTFTDNGPLTIADADLDKIVAIVSLTSYIDFVDNSFAGISGLAIPYFSNTDGNVFVAMVVRGAPTYVAITDLFLSISQVYG